MILEGNKVNSKINNGVSSYANPLFFCFILALILSGCGQSQQKQIFTIEGTTMGTTYKISYVAGEEEVIKADIDSLLNLFNLSLSTYIDSSSISKINRTYKADSLFEIDKSFYEVFRISEKVHRATDEAFDPSVMPLVHFWGFGVRKNLEQDTSKLDSLRQLVGLGTFGAVAFDGKYFIKKSNPYAQLDFNAVAQGYASDVVADYFEAKDITDYMIEIGGEVRCNGSNNRNTTWTIGIDKPENSDAQTRQLKATVLLNNASLATSGNYRKFLKQEGKKYGHTINPKTGFPEVNTTLSVSVVTRYCGYADAYATAFMVMGHEKAFEFAERDTSIEAYFIYSDEKGNMLTKETSGLKNVLKELE
jgi:thiamine biosynthesis lipoprotein